MSAASDAVFQLAHGYFWGWQEGNWAQLRAALAPDVEFEDPSLGHIEGIDPHVALYADGKRFPDRSGVALRRFLHDEEVATISYDVYLGLWRKLTVIDQLSVRDGHIVHVLSVADEWPPRTPPAE